MGINTTMSVLVSDNLQAIATEDAAKTAVAKANAAKQATINAAVSMGDLKALAIAIRPAGEFARVSCPSSLEFGDTDINYHGKRIAGLADAHEADRDRIMYQVGKIASRIHGVYGMELSNLQANRVRLQAQATKHGDAVRRIDVVIAVLKEELALRESDRAAYKAKVEADRVAREAAVEAARITAETALAARKIAVIEPEATVTSLPAKWLKKPSKVKKVAVKRDEIKVNSFEELAEIIVA
jgi:hypothetical protein